MWIVVGLGNPGSKYAFTRHNIGFMALDIFLKSCGDLPWKDEKKAHVCKFKFKSEELLCVKPQTFMNLSGEPVRALMDFYKIELKNLIVVHDDIDQEFGSIKIQKNRGAGGHNGLKSINEQMGSMDYYRIKLGVGRPPHPKMEVADYVLQNFSKDEEMQLGPYLNVACDGLESLLVEGYDKAATKYNRHYL